MFDFTLKLLICAVKSTKDKNSNKVFVGFFHAGMIFSQNTSSE